MVNLFNMLHKEVDTLNSTDYWNTEEWGRGIDPTGNPYDEKEMYESIEESDRQRLLKYQ